jgi:hypothetical protein
MGAGINDPLAPTAHARGEVSAAHAHRYEVIAVSQPASATSQITPARLPPGLLRAGAVCALVGGVGYLVLSVAHGNLPSTSGPPALRFVATRPGWPAIYLGLLACVLLWPVASAALAGSITREPARLLGWLAAASVLVGAAVFAVDAALNGLALKTVADDWAAAPSAALLQLGDTMVRLAYATFSTYLMLLLGLPFGLAGLAMAASRSYPAWLGLLGAAAGAGALVAGATRFLGLHGVVPDGLLFGVFVLAGQVWLVLVGVLLWRQAATAPPLEATAHRRPSAPARSAS